MEPLPISSPKTPLAALFQPLLCVLSMPSSFLPLLLLPLSPTSSSSPLIPPSESASHTCLLALPSSSSPPIPQSRLTPHPCPLSLPSSPLQLLLSPLSPTSSSSPFIPPSEPAPHPCLLVPPSFSSSHIPPRRLMPHLCPLLPLSSPPPIAIVAPLAHVLLLASPRISQASWRCTPASSRCPSPPRLASPFFKLAGATSLPSLVALLLPFSPDY